MHPGAARLLPTCGRLPPAAWLGAASAADFLAANADEFQIMNALLKKSGLAGALASDLANTYFLPPDSAFLLDLGVSWCWCCLAWGMCSVTAALAMPGQRCWTAPLWCCGVPAQLLLLLLMQPVSPGPLRRSRRLSSAWGTTPTCSP